MKVMVIGNAVVELTGDRRHLLMAMAERGHEVIVAAPGLIEDDARQDLERLGLTCDQFPLSRTGLDPLGEWRTYKSLAKMMERHRPDLVYAMTIKPVIYGTLAAASTGVPNRFAHITGLGYAFTGPRSGKRAIVGAIVERLYRKALAKADTIFFENEDDLSLFRERDLIPVGKGRRIDGSGVDLSRFSQQPWPDGAMSFLFVGRLLKAKGLPELAEAMRRIRQDFPDVRLKLAGPLDANPDAIDRSDLDGWIEDGLVDYLGMLENVGPAYAAAHVFVLPSHREGLPRSTVEGMATGRPIITTDAPGCRDTVVAGENGLLVPVKDPDAIAEAMRWMITHPEEARMMGERSRQMAVDRFSVERVNAQFLDAMGL